MDRVAENVVWPKLRSLAAGAQLAGGRLFSPVLEALSGRRGSNPDA